MFSEVGFEKHNRIIKAINLIKIYSITNTNCLFGGQWPCARSGRLDRSCCSCCSRAARTFSLIIWHLRIGSLTDILEWIIFLIFHLFVHIWKISNSPLPETLDTKSYIVSARWKNQISLSLSSYLLLRNRKSNVIPIISTTKEQISPPLSCKHGNEIQCSLCLSRYFLLLER